MIACALLLHLQKNMQKLQQKSISTPERFGQGWRSTWLRILKLKWATVIDEMGTVYGKLCFCSSHLNFEENLWPSKSYQFN